MPKSPMKMQKSKNHYISDIKTPCGKTFINKHNSNLKIKLHQKICPECKKINSSNSIQVNQTDNLSYERGGIAFKNITIKKDSGIIKT